MQRTRITTGRFLGTLVAATLVALAARTASAQDRSLDLPVDAPVFAPKATTPPPPPLPLKPGDDRPPTFFGSEVKTETQSIVYVIDQSGSMSLSVQPFTDDAGNTVQSGNRLDRAKSELRRSIASLPETFKFNVIFYDECVRTWQSQTVLASLPNKKAAFAWVAQQEPMGFTNTGLAVASALADKANKMVVLLSDGEPNFMDCAANYVGSFDQHRGMVRTANTQTAKIDSFGIGVASDPDARRFMQDVASENGGTYVECN